MRNCQICNSNGKRVILNEYNGTSAINPTAPNLCLFECTSCGHIANGIEFEPIEYTWKENPEKWRVWVDKRISEDAEKLIDKIIKDVKEPKRKLIG